MVGSEEKRMDSENVGIPQSNQNRKDGLSNSSSVNAGNTLEKVSTTKSPDPISTPSFLETGKLSFLLQCIYSPKKY